MGDLRAVMSSLSSRQFTTISAEDSVGASRCIRRIVINADILKTCKVYAGDVVALSDANNPTIGNVRSIVYIVSQWPTYSHSPLPPDRSSLLGLRGHHWKLHRIVGSWHSHAVAICFAQFDELCSRLSLAFAFIDIPRWGRHCSKSFSIVWGNAC